MIALYCMVSGIVYSTDNLFILIVTGECTLLSVLISLATNWGRVAS